MPTARKDLIDLEATPYYHCINRCVRRAYLCGEDDLTGKSFEHRRQWLLDRIHFLAENFAIDICAYAIMHNHYHLVLKVNTDVTPTWSEEEVIERWTSVYSCGHVLVERYQAGKGSEYEKQTAKNIINIWRRRLSEISWFMKALNEFIARKANGEDECKGHFWEGRFTSQALLDENAVLSCMIYVDLNPVRAGIAQDLIDSDFTSIQERIKAFTLAQVDESELTSDHSDSNESSKKSEKLGNTGGKGNLYQPKTLLKFTDRQCKVGIYFSLLDYLALADWTGRCIRADKRGAINERRPDILAALGIEDDDWFELAANCERKFAGFVGNKAKLYAHANKHGQYFCRGVG